MVGRAPRMNGRPSSRLSRMARLLSMRAFKNAITAGSPGGLAKFFRNRYGPRKPVTFWLSKMIQRNASSRSVPPPGPDQARPPRGPEPLVLALGLELARALGEVGQDHAGLGEFLVAVHEDRPFAQPVDL